MAIEVVLPQLGESVAEGVVTRWLKHPGDAVALDEPLVEITTDKVNVELPSPADGVLECVLAPEGATVPVQAVLARIAPTSDAAPGDAIADAPAPAAEPAAPAPPAAAAPAFSPLVRRIAVENALDLERLVSAGQLVGTGEGGRVTKADLLAVLERIGGSGATLSAAPATRADAAGPPPIEAPHRASGEVAADGPASDEIVVPFSGMRKMIADRLVHSAFTAPHVTTVAEADVTRLVAYRAANCDAWERDYGLKLTVTPFFVKAAAEALQAFPMVNASLQGDRIIARRSVHMGIAVSLGPGGLIVPVIRGAHEKDVVALAREIEDLARRAREGALTPADVQGGTFTITNPGVYGAILSTPIINAPQAAILGVEAIRKAVVVREDDSLAIRSMVYLCLSYDHRVVDGETSIRFLQHVRRGLEDFRFMR